MEMGCKKMKSASIVVVIILFACLTFFSGIVKKPAPANIAFAAVGDSETITATVEPEGANQSVTWKLEPDKSKMTKTLSGWVDKKLKDGNVYIEVTVVSENSCVVTAKQYFRYGIKYTTHWILTATSVENPNYFATCEITLG